VLLAWAISGEPQAWAALTWTPGEGWSSGDDKSKATANSRAQLDQSRKLEADGDWKSAMNSYTTLVKRWPLSFHAGEAQFKVGWTLEKMADWEKAFKAYQTCIDKYPNSNFFDMAIERQYNIGNLYLAGERRKVWKIPLMASMEKTIEMFDQVVKNAPYGKWAPEAQFKKGQAYERQRKWSEAVKAYQIILDRYPTNDLIDDAHYQIGFAWYQAARSAEYDQGAAEKSIDAYEEFLTRFPNSEKVSQAEANLRELKGRTTEGAFNIARFYDQQKRYDAAILYYKDVIQKEPNSPNAEFSRKRIEELDPKRESGPPVPEDLEKIQAQAAEQAAREAKEAEQIQKQTEAQTQAQDLLPGDPAGDASSAEIGPVLPPGVTLPPPAPAASVKPSPEKAPTNKREAVPPAPSQPAKAPVPPAPKPAVKPAVTKAPPPPSKPVPEAALPPASPKGAGAKAPVQAEEELIGPVPPRPDTR